MMEFHITLLTFIPFRFKISNFLNFVPVDTKRDILSFLSSNKEIFREQFHITRIGLFGSYARGEQNKESDLDLIVEFEENTQNLYDLKLQLKDFFRSNLGMEVDICREKYIKPWIKKSILQEAIYVN